MAVDKPYVTCIMDPPISVVQASLAYLSPGTFVSKGNLNVQGKYSSLLNKHNLGPIFCKSCATLKLEVRQYNITHNTLDEYDGNNRHYGYCITILQK